MMKKLILILSAVLLTVFSTYADERFNAPMNAFPADGQSCGRISYCFDAKKGERPAQGPFGDISAVEIISRETGLLCENIFFKSTGKAGIVRFEGAGGTKIHLTFYKISADIDDDGFPDEAELISEDDREAFRGWFVRIAESQFLRRSFSWKDTQRDCAGLIRFAYREALKEHDAQWLIKSGIVIDKNLPDIRRFHYPAVPVLGKNLFKQKTGSALDVNSFGSFADAETLLKYNAGFVSRSFDDVKKGDILFFRINSTGRQQYHSMIVAGVENREPLIIYHTGKEDIIKRVPLSYLKGSGAFDPSSSNDRFLGIYRFHILE